MSARTLSSALFPSHTFSFHVSKLNPTSTSLHPATRNPLCWSSRSLGVGFSINSRLFKRLCSSRPEWSCSLELPLLPFQPEEVLIPSELKILHLYEARFLALLEESLLRRQKFFVHFVLDPVITGRSSSAASFAARYGCLVIIENVKQLDIGALVSIRGISRVSIVKLVQIEPYLRGVVLPMLDNTPDHESEINSKLMELSESLYNLHSLQIKLRASKDELLQTPTRNSLEWAEREVQVDCDQVFIPKLAERVSFAALQPVSGCSGSELLSLQRKKLQAMETRDTMERMTIGIQFVKDNIAMVAAKLAIQSLGL